MEIYVYELENIMHAWLWAFFRIGAMFMTAPVIGTRSVPVRIRLMIVIAITMLIAPLISVPQGIEILSYESILISVQQILIGICMGLSFRFIFVVVELAGQSIGQLMGLMMASMIDPQSGNQVPIIGQFYLLLSTLLFITIDGHLLLIQALAMSFYDLPVGLQGISETKFWDVLIWFGQVLAYSVLIILPAMVCMLIVNLSFGIMARTAPQLNIFAVGFPIMIIVGVIVVMLSLKGFVTQMITLFDSGFSMLDTIIQ